MKRILIIVLTTILPSVNFFAVQSLAASNSDPVSTAIVDDDDDDDDDDLKPRKRAKKPSNMEVKNFKKPEPKSSKPGKKISKPWFMGKWVLLGKVMMNYAEVGDVKLWLHPDGTYRFLNIPIVGLRTDIQGKYDWDGSKSSFRLFLYDKNNDLYMVFEGSNNSLSMSDDDDVIVSTIKLWPADYKTNNYVYPRENKY